MRVRVLCCDAVQDFQRLAGMSDAGSVGHVTSFVQQSTVPDQAPMPCSGNAPAPMTAQSMGRAPGRAWEAATCLDLPLTAHDWRSGAACERLAAPNRRFAIAPTMHHQLRVPSPACLQHVHIHVFLQALATPLRERTLAWTWRAF